MSTLPDASSGTTPSAGDPPASGFTITLVNAIAGYAPTEIYWALFGQNSDAAYCYVNASGQLIPMSANDNGSDGFANYCFTLNDVSSVTIPAASSIDSGQIWIALGAAILIHVDAITTKDVTTVTGFTPPSVTNPGVPGYQTIFQIAEFAYNTDGTHHLNVDTSAVDYMGIPLQIDLTDSAGTSHVGFSATRTALFQSFLQCPDTTFRDLVIANLRILSPEHAARVPGGYTPPPELGIPATTIDTLSTFYDTYIHDCWAHYTDATITFNAQDDPTKPAQPYTGQVQNDQLTFYAGSAPGGTPVLSLPRPQTWEVFQCAGIFKFNADGTLLNTLQQNLAKVVVAAIYRTVLMTPLGDVNAPWFDSAAYYTNPPINYYAKLLHDQSDGGQCYAFAFDDVGNHSSSLASTTTQSLTLTLPAW